MILRRSSVLLAGALVLAGLVGAPGAQADEFDVNTSPSATGTGYQVAVSFSGNAAPAGGSTRTVGVRASCWWARMQGPSDDASKEYDWFAQNQSQNSTVPGYASNIYDQNSYWQDAVTKQKSGTDVIWYRATCRNRADYQHFNAGTQAGNTANALTLVIALPAGQSPPAPMIAPADLAQAARDAMVIPVPATQRNPKVDSAGQPTLVGLPTWFWVTNAASVGGPAGTLTIRATAGGAWAEVTATTGGLQLNSPAGGTTCGPARATVKYAEGVAESSACTIEFDRASVAYPKGYPVTATTNWAATWAGSDGETGALDGLTRAVTVNVPVAEVQNVVTS